MRIAVGIQARMGSGRLPGKVLKYVGDHTVLEHVVTRCQESGAEVCVLTPSGNDNAPIWMECARLGAEYYAPAAIAENDVLGRYVHWAGAWGLDTVVRVSADCPFIEWHEIQRLVGHAALGRARGLNPCVANCNPRRVPDGYDVEVVPVGMLARADKFGDDADHEHVTRYIHREYGDGASSPPDDDSVAHWRFTLDEPADLEWFCEVAAEIDVTPPYSPVFADLHELMQRRPDLKAHAWTGPVLV